MTIQEAVLDLLSQWAESNPDFDLDYSVYQVETYVQSGVEQFAALEGWVFDEEQCRWIKGV